MTNVDDGVEWVVISQAQDPAAAKAAAYDHLATLGVFAEPTPDEPTMGLVGISDDDIRIDLMCGREPADTSTRISIRESRLDAVRQLRG